jgi:hypothetical protein
VTSLSYILAAIILTPVSVVVFARWLKRRLDRDYPSADRELEAQLADRLAVCLSKEARS